MGQPPPRATAARRSFSAGGAPRALEIDDALPIAKQIADALEAAHDQGIVHRDLKPANIKIKSDGTVNVLDFGLAKAMDPAGASSAGAMSSPTITTPAMPFDWRSGHPEQGRGVTRMGMILGTAAYMAPEQARGRAVDKRAAIWAFGCVLFEMLTRPAKGVAHLPSSWSPKDETLLFSVVPDTGSRRAPRSPAERPNSLWALTRTTGKEAPLGGVQSGSAIGAVFSPGGRWVAYASGGRGVGRGGVTVYVQPFPATGATYQLPANGGVPHDHVWSPDGKQLFYNPRVGALEAVSVTTQPTFAFGSPVAVPGKLFMAGPAIERPYDITPDGRFVGLIEPGQRPGADPLAPDVHIVVSWFEELKRLVPAK